MFEGERFWYLLVGGDPVNVVRRDDAVRYHRWSEKSAAWVRDNSLFLDVDGPNARRSQARPVERGEALRWLTENTSFRPATGDRVVTIDAELRALAHAAAAGDSRSSVRPRLLTPALADLLRRDPAERQRAEGLLASLAEVDAGRRKNPWFSDDRRDMEWAVRRYVHHHLDVGADTTVSLDTERMLRDAVALAGG